MSRARGSGVGAVVDLLLIADADPAPSRSARKDFRRFSKAAIFSKRSHHADRGKARLDGYLTAILNLSEQAAPVAGIYA